MSQYADDELVYVNPETRSVVSVVKFSANGEPEPLEMEPRPLKDTGDKKRRKPKKRYYPWGTYRTMKKLYRIEGKEKEIENYKTLDSAIDLALEQPYWD